MEYLWKPLKRKPKTKNLRKPSYWNSGRIKLNSQIGGG